MHSIVGPNAANYYKINDLISKHQFQKYKKRGYHITPVVVDSMKAVRGRASSLTLHYWSQQESQYCTTKGKKQVHDVKVCFSFLVAFSIYISLFTCITLYYPDGSISRLDVRAFAKTIVVGKVFIILWIFKLVVQLYYP